jgi:hypothetical protein
MNKTVADYRSRILKVEQPVWDVLTPSPIQTFRRLLSEPEAKE